MTSPPGAPEPPGGGLKPAKKILHVRGKKSLFFNHRDQTSKKFKILLTSINLFQHCNYLQLYKAAEFGDFTM